MLIYFKFYSFMKCMLIIYLWCQQLEKFPLLTYNKIPPNVHSRGYCDDLAVFVLTALKFALLVYPRKISRRKCVS